MLAEQCIRSLLCSYMCVFNAPGLSVNEANSDHVYGSEFHCSPSNVLLLDLH